MLVDKILNASSEIEIRQIILEAQRTFAPGSLPSVVVEFDKAIREYYFDLAVHQFQLYSDRPTQMFTPVYCHIGFTDGLGKEQSVEIKDISKIDFSELRCLNHNSAYALESLTLQYAFTPEMQHLFQSVESDDAAKLFKKNRSFAVKSGSREYLEGSFVPLWSDTGLLIRSVSFTRDSGSATGIHGLPSVARIDYI